MPWHPDDDADREPFFGLGRDLRRGLPGIALPLRCNGHGGDSFITEEQARRLEAIRRQAKGPPYRMTFDFPPPVLSDEEMAKELAQAEYDDEMGVDPDPLTYTTLRAQTLEAAHRG